MADVDGSDIQRLLDEVWSTDTIVRQNAAATLSKIAAKASDPVLEEMSIAAPIFVELLMEDEPLLRAYTACIIANVAFLEIGQKRVLEAGGVPLVVRLLRQRDRKVQLHSSAAVQNLTYKNPQCCFAVLEEGGEKALNKLLRHKSEDIQQFAAGALANLQLYRRGLEAEAQAKAAGGGPVGLSSQQPKAGGKAPPAHAHKAATVLQAAVRGRQERRRYDYLLQTTYSGAHASRAAARGFGNGNGNANGFGRKQVEGDDMVGSNRYDVFRVKDVRTQLDILPPSLPPIGAVGQQPRPMARNTMADGPIGVVGLPGPRGGPRRLEPLQAKQPPPRACSAHTASIRASAKCAAPDSTLARTGWPLRPSSHRPSLSTPGACSRAADSIPIPVGVQPSGQGPGGPNNALPVLSGRRP